MGFYINVPKDTNKAEQIIDMYGGKLLVAPPPFEEIPKDKALIAVVHNIGFEAAGFVFDKSEYDRMVLPTLQDTRTREFVLIDRKKAEELSGFNDL